MMAADFGARTRLGSTERDESAAVHPKLHTRNPKTGNQIPTPTRKLKPKIRNPKPAGRGGRRRGLRQRCAAPARLVPEAAPVGGALPAFNADFASAAPRPPLLPGK